MDESAPIRPRSGSVGLIDTPIDMGPATALISPRRYSNLEAVGGEVLELIAPPPMTDKEGEAVDQLYQEPLEQCYTVRDSVSTDAWENSASTSVTMEPDYVVLDLNTNTVLQPIERNDELPPCQRHRRHWDTEDCSRNQPPIHYGADGHWPGHLQG